ncbi:[Fe-Fe] hydrogenase large subunit C-terminal domain-containing protein [Thermohalobacter berrensis]|uniref:Ferredoxin n=1 Tax=Thermohalobacter berrensis TaxID=99594 RepID=A0A419T6X3_9FIRM|nr:[Fe-Fe] hydrogenase large subunit C-terminal domain-containing protein [Thermohalobacter berrensis]RKD33186.1 ferredoxin [Thermohalobacter berrensis]
MKEYFHSVILDETKCNGCTNCMRRCPTEAIRIKDKKAHIIKERCIDCGECIRVCPYYAQNSATDDLNKLKEYKFNIAIVPFSMYGQFSSDLDMDKIFQGIKSLGFDYVYDEAHAADIATISIKQEIKKTDLPKPIISSLCPAVLRLIQINFPSLIDNIIRIESPMEIAGRLAKKKVMDEYNLDSDEVGVFYLTHCPAKVTSIKNPIGIKNSYIDGAIAIKRIYGDILRNATTVKKVESFSKGSSLGIGWAKVGGQSEALGIENYIAVDGIENVIKVLEEAELGKLDNIDYIEAMACVGGCVGGPLTVENPFIAKSRIRRTIEEKSKIMRVNEEEILNLYKEGIFSLTEEIEAKGIMKLDEDIKMAIRKIEKIKQITDSLPGLDCGSCGAPTCRALAEDIVLGYATIDNCVFRMNKSTNISK